MKIKICCQIINKITFFIKSEGNLIIKSSKRFILDYKNKDAKLMSNIEKTKYIFADNFIKAIELYFKNLIFQNIAKFYKMKNIKSLKQYCAFKKHFSVKVAEKI